MNFSIYNTSINNNQINNFTINNILSINNFDKLKSKNILSLSLYKTNNASSIQFSKNYILILKYAKQLAKLFNLSLLLFIDYTIYENTNYINQINKIKDKNIIIIKYDSLNIRKHLAYQQFYGEIIKFLPLFNYNKNLFNEVYIFDYEDYLNTKILINSKKLLDDIKLWKLSKNIKQKHKLDIIFYVYPYTKLNYKFNDANPLYINKDKLVLSSNYIICNYKFNYKIFDNIINNSTLYGKQLIKNNLIKHEITSQTFLTFILYDYIKKCKYGYIEYFNINYIIDKIFYNLYDPELTEKKLNIYKQEVIKLSQFVLQTDNTNIKQLYKLLLNLTNKKRLYEYLMLLYKSKNYNIFDKHSLEYILKYNNVNNTFNFIYKDKFNYYEC